mgnify:CR=1 FL=1
MKQLGILAFLVVLFESQRRRQSLSTQAWRADNETSGSDLGGHRRLCAFLLAASIMGFLKSTALNASTSISAANRRRSPRWPNDQVQFNYGAADGSLPGLAAGVEAKIVASPLVKLPLRHGRAERDSPARRSQRKIHRRDPAG